MDEYRNKLDGSYSIKVLKLYKSSDDENAYALVNYSTTNELEVKIGAFDYVGKLFIQGVLWLQDDKEPLVIEAEK